MDTRKDAKKKEDQWFVEQERKLIEQARAKRLQKMKEETEREETLRREELKQLHWMRCPKCGHEMNEKEYQLVKVDVCSLCEGVYFDRGELEDLVLQQMEAKKGFLKKILGL